jgi:hypothetical protein
VKKLEDKKGCVSSQFEIYIPSSLSPTSSHSKGLNMSTSKGEDAPSQHHAEDVESQIAKPDLQAHNGDAVAQMIGAQHIEVTEEDVRSLNPLHYSQLTLV